MLLIETGYYSSLFGIWKEISSRLWPHCESWPAWIEHWCVRGFLCSSPFIPEDRVVCLQSCIEFQLCTQARQKIFKLSAQSLQLFFLTSISRNFQWKITCKYHGFFQILDWLENEKVGSICFEIKVTQRTERLLWNFYPYISDARKGFYSSPFSTQHLFNNKYTAGRYYPSEMLFINLTDSLNQILSSGSSCRQYSLEKMVSYL